MSERTTWQRIARRIRVPLGFIFAGVFLWLARPTWQTMLWSLVLVVPGVWLRAYAAGYVRKNAELTRTGPYAYTRNPLYLGSMMIAFGFAWAAASWIIFVALAVLFFAIYLPTIHSEEAYLREHFPGFDDYASKFRDFCHGLLRPAVSRKPVYFLVSVICTTASTMLVWVPSPSMRRWRRCFCF